MKNNYYDALIIGGGPAGCSCALWLKHLGLKPLIVEKRARLGGLQNESPYPNVWILGKNYPNGKAFAQAVSQQIQGERVSTCLEGEVNSLSHSEKDGLFDVEIKRKSKVSLKIQTPFLVLASGVVPRTDGFQSSSSVLIGPGDHIENTNFKGKTVAILGGGDNAFENYQFIRRQKPKVTKIFARNVRAQFSFVQKIRSGDLFLGDYTVDANQQSVNGTSFDFLVVMYGWKGVNALEPWISLEMEGQFVKTDPFRRTSVDRVYAVGEVTQMSHPCCVTAMADGIIAAKDIQKRIDEIRVSTEVRKKLLGK